MPPFRLLRILLSQKTDIFLLLLDTSGSMGVKYKGRPSTK